VETTATLKERVEQAVAEARETIAFADEAIARTRRVLQRTEETLQHIRARHERDAERNPPLGVPSRLSPNSWESHPRQKLVPAA
jgi:hypothetical protein